MIASILISLPESDFSAFEARLHKVGIVYRAASRTTREQLNSSKSPIVEIGGRISTNEYAYIWKKSGDGAQLSIDAVLKGSSVTHALVRDLEEAFPECKSIAVVDSPRVRFSGGERIILACLAGVFAAALYGFWGLISIVAHASS